MTKPGYTHSRLATLMLIGASGFALPGCYNDHAGRVETAVMSADTGCSDGSERPDGLSVSACLALKEEARKEHARSAPRYDEIDLCEEQHGPDQCLQAGAGSGSSDPVFLPLMAGYMMARTGNFDSYQARPLVAARGGGFTTVTGTGHVSRLDMTTRKSRDMFSKTPPRTVGKPPMTRATVTSRGGFGGSRGGGTSARAGG